MKQNRALFQQLSVIAFGTLLLFTTSCSKQDIPAAQAKANNAHHSTSRMADYSDEDVFKGIVFLDGRVASLFPDQDAFSIENITNDQAIINNRKQAEDSIIQRLLALDPQYLANFRMNVGSGDYDLIKSTIENASFDALKMMAAIKGTTSNDLQSELQDEFNKFAHDYSITPGTSNQDMLRAIQQRVSYNGQQIVIDSWIVIETVLWTYQMRVCVMPDSQSNTFLSEEFYSTLASDYKGI